MLKIESVGQNDIDVGRRNAFLNEQNELDNVRHMFYKKLGRRLTAERRRNKISVAEMADWMMIPVRRYRDAERGDVPLSVFELFMFTLKTNPEMAFAMRQYMD